MRGGNLPHRIAQKQTHERGGHAQRVHERRIDRLTAGVRSAGNEQQQIHHLETEHGEYRNRAKPPNAKERGQQEHAGDKREYDLVHAQHVEAALGEQLDGRNHERGAAHAKHDALERAKIALRNHVANHLPHETDGAHAEHRTSHIAQQHAATLASERFRFIGNDLGEAFAQGPRAERGQNDDAANHEPFRWQKADGNAQHNRAQRRKRNVDRGARGAF